MANFIVMILLITLIGLLFYQIRIDTITRKRQFDIQMEMAIGQQAMTKELTWAELKKLIDEIINFTVNNYIITNGITKMDEAELSLNWTGMLGELCTDIERSLSDEMKRQVLKSISLEYLTNYIKNSTQLIMVYSLQNNKNNTVNKKLENIHNNIHSGVDKKSN